MGNKISRRPDQGRMEALARLSVKVAHDINNVLGAIEGYATLAGRSVDAGSQLKSDMDDVRAAVVQGAALTGFLMLFGGRRMLRPAPCRARELLAAAADSFCAAQPDCKTEITAAQDLPEVNADPELLKTALKNLLQNAGEAMPAGGLIKLSAEVLRAEPPGGGPDAVFLRLAVADQGPGISDEALEKAFEPFFSTKPKSKGVGLGLPLAYGIARQHGGWAEGGRLPGGGSEFSLFIPVQKS